MGCWPVNHKESPGILSGTLAEVYVILCCFDDETLSPEEYASLGRFLFCVRAVAFRLNPPWHATPQVHIFHQSN